MRLRATVVADGPAEVELSWAPGDGRRHVLRVASAGREPSAARTQTKTQTLDGAVLAPKVPMRLELESVDGDLRAWIDGKEASILSDELPMAEAERIEDRGRASRRRSCRSACGAPPSRSATCASTATSTTRTTGPTRASSRWPARRS